MKSYMERSVMVRGRWVPFETWRRMRNFERFIKGMFFLVAVGSIWHIIIPGLIVIWRGM